MSFEAEPGSIVGLIGANGSGKTTTLDVISGLVAPQSGRVRLDDIDLAEYLPEERLGVGMVRSFQDCRLFPELTVLDVLLLCEDARQEVAVLSTTLRLPWARRAERRKLEAVDQVIAAFGLERFRHHRTAELSTGTRRVVDLASVVLAKPRLLLLDEPTAGIAQREAEAFIPLLRRLHEVADTTIVLVEHDVPLVFELCSTVVVMELGRVVAAGPPEVIRADPKALAAYLGASDEALMASGPIGEGGGADRRRRRVSMEASMEVPAHRGAAFHPWRPLGRSWRRLRRRPRAMQVRTALIVIAIVVGLVAWLVLAPSGTPGGSGSAGAAEVAVEHHAPTPPSQASTSTRGVSATSINVVFPVVAINSLAGKEGFAAGQGVQRADPGHPPLREPGQQRGRHQRPQDQPDHRAVRPDQRRQHAVAVPAVDPGQPGRSSRSSTASAPGWATTSSA